MAAYLQLNGTSDYVLTPSTSAFSESFVEMDIWIDNAPSSIGTISKSAGNYAVFLNTNGTVNFDSAKVSSLKLNGVSATSDVTVFPLNTNVTLRMAFTGQNFWNNYIFTQYSAGGGYVKGRIYALRYYASNGTTITHSFDTTHSGATLTDLVGTANGTVNGGTWVSDVTGTIQTGSSSVQGVSTITADATVIGAITGSASLQGVATLAATATVLNAPMLGSAALQGISTLAATGNKVQTGGASLTGVATSTAFAEGLTVLGGASLSGVGVLTASGVSGASIARAISLFGSLPSPIALLGEKAASIHLLSSFTDTIALQGSKPSIIALEGGLMATKTNQDFTMYAGDTPPLTFTMADSTNLSGATVKWAMRKGNVKGPQVLLKTTSSGLAVSGTVGTITLLSADTISLEGKFYHEAEVTDISGIVSTVMTGIITILPSGT